MPETFPAMAGPAAARCLAAQLGIAPTWPSAPHADGAGELLAHVQRAGIDARLAAIDAGELADLALPSLLMLRDGNWLLAVGRTRTGLEVVGDDGRRQALPWPAIEDAFAGMALDRIEPLPAATTLPGRLVMLLKRERRLLAQLTFFGLAVQCVHLAAPWLIGIAVDRVLPAARADLLMLVLAGMALTTLTAAVFEWGERRAEAYLEMRLAAHLECGMLLHLIRLPMRLLESRNVGQLMQCFQGFSAARSLLAGEAATVLVNGVAVLVFLVLMVSILPVQTLWIVGAAVISVLTSHWSGRRQELLHRQQVARQVAERRAAADLVTHIAMLKAAGAERRHCRTWSDLMSAERTAGLRAQRAENLGEAVVALLGQMVLAATWIAGGQSVIEGTISLGPLLAFMLLAQGFLAGMAGLGRSLVTLRTIRPYLDEAADMLGRQPVAIADATRAGAGPKIEVRDLWFRYGTEQPWIFSGYDLAVEAGTAFRIAGPSGFGKSTLLKLLGGLYEPERGSLLIDGLPPTRQRDRLIYLPQFPQLFAGNIRDNLRLFSAGAPDDRIAAAAASTGLQDLLDGWPMGFETVVAAGGANFSGGQRQLIALTGVLASDRDILLLDEATANLDALRSRELASSELLSGRTVIYTCHGDAGHLQVPPVVPVQAASASSHFRKATTAGLCATASAMTRK